MLAVKRRAVNESGAALVEFAIVASLFFLLVFGIIEFGLMIKDYLALCQGVREGARAACLGNSISTVVNTVQQSVPALDVSNLSNINVYYRKREGGAWPSTWISGLPDSVAAGEEVQVKVSARYAHELVTGSLFGSGPVMLHSEMVWRRE